MTTDPAAKAAERLVPYKERDWYSRDENERRYLVEVEKVAAIIRRAYEPRELLLERAVAALGKVVDWRNGPEGPDVLFSKGSAMVSDVERVLADAASLGIGRTPE